VNITNGETEREYEYNKGERQWKIAQLRMAGLHNQERIAKICGVSQATISRDMKEIDNQTKQSAMVDLATAKGAELIRLERLIAAVWETALKLKGATIRDQMAAIDRIIKLIEVKAKLLGLNAPVTVNLVNDEATRLAREFGLDKSEIMKEAERILGGSNMVTAGNIDEYAGIPPEIKEFE
jgi:hypothetical protein